MTVRTYVLKFAKQKLTARSLRKLSNKHAVRFERHHVSVRRRFSTRHQALGRSESILAQVEAYLLLPSCHIQCDQNHLVLIALNMSKLTFCSAPDIFNAIRTTWS